MALYAGPVCRSQECKTLKYGRVFIVFSCTWCSWMRSSPTRVGVDVELCGVVQRQRDKGKYYIRLWNLHRCLPECYCFAGIKCIFLFLLTVTFSKNRWMNLNGYGYVRQVNVKHEKCSHRHLSFHGLPIFFFFSFSHTGQSPLLEK